MKVGSVLTEKMMKKIDFEMYLSAGDILMHYPTVVHYVDEVDPKETLDWKSKKGDGSLVSIQMI